MKWFAIDIFSVMMAPIPIIQSLIFDNNSADLMK
jgi:hypothetical protein